MSDDFDPLSGQDSGPDEDYVGDYERALQLMRRIRKEDHFNPPLRQPTADRRPATTANDGPYHTRDVGGVGFDLDEEFDQPYDAVRVNASGDVQIETATGEQSIIASDAEGVFEEVSVSKVISGGTTVSPDAIVLYRH